MPTKAKKKPTPKVHPEDGAAPAIVPYWDRTIIFPNGVTLRNGVFTGSPDQFETLAEPHRSYSLAQEAAPSWPGPVRLEDFRALVDLSVAGNTFRNVPCPEEWRDGLSEVGLRPGHPVMCRATVQADVELGHATLTLAPEGLVERRQQGAAVVETPAPAHTFSGTPCPQQWESWLVEESLVRQTDRVTFRANVTAKVSMFSETYPLTITPEGGELPAVELQSPREWRVAVICLRTSSLGAVEVCTFQASCTAEVTLGALQLVIQREDAETVTIEAHAECWRQRNPKALGKSGKLVISVPE